MQSAHAKLQKLRELLGDMGSVVVAFSGGLDSSFVLKVATDVLGDKAMGLTAVSASMPQRERREAVRVAGQLGARHVLIESRELQDANYASNPRNRCYYCKSELFALAHRKRQELGFSTVVDGANLDDLGDFRPGLDAGREAGVRSPLVEAGLTKAEIRELAREMSLDFSDKPASACLSSRIPYGVAVTAERLQQIERLEDALMALGLKQVRARFHYDVARIEVAKDEMETAFRRRDEIAAAGKAAGFSFVALDLEGYRTGSLNEPPNR